MIAKELACRSSEPPRPRPESHLREHGCQGGASLFDVLKLLGHQDIEMTQRYAHLSDDEIKKATAGAARLAGQNRLSTAPCP